MTGKPALVVDFVAVLDEIRRHGFSLRAVAGHIGVDVSTVHDYHNGAIPRFHVGERLLDLWAGVTGKPTSAVPRTPSMPTVSAARLW